ncbi:MAG: RNA-binding S4 domain-containing protein [Bacteroidota bacterium]|jgi:ribosome-associated protein
MKKEKFEIEGEYIELIQLLKALNIAETGGQAKMMVDDGEVKLNGETEHRKRAKLRKGDVVEVNAHKIELV